MNLETWMTKNKMTDERLAAMLSVSASAVQKWRVGKRMPRPNQIKKIFDMTNESVGANDFVLNYSKEERK